MAEGQLAVASAVIVPDEIVEPSSEPYSSKRRHSPLPDDTAKRPRMSQDSSGTGQNIASDAPTSDRASDRRRSGQMEERKRGQRLFGALLSTLSQSSSSTAQKRRTDIEKRQQAKLKLQAEEYDEEKKLRLEALMEVRRREQKKYNKQSMQIRHSNLLAEARFLHTQAEPKLYYKPWELLPGDDDKIKAQIEEAERLIERETVQFEADNHNLEGPTSDTNKKPPEDMEMEGVATSSETVGFTTNLQNSSISPAVGDTNYEPVPVPASAPAPTPEIPPPKADDPVDVSKDQGDDGGEIVFEGEDTVIY